MVKLYCSRRNKYCTWRGWFCTPIINNGSFNKEPNQSLIEDTIVVVESSGIFTFGQTAIDTIKNAETSTVINIKQGITTVDGVKPGVEIKNDINNDLIVNGYPVIKNEEIIVPETQPKSEQVDQFKQKTSTQTGYDDGGHSHLMHVAVYLNAGGIRFIMHQLG